VSTAADYTPGEEIAHSVTHGVGAALSVAGLALLAALASQGGDGWHVAACCVYGATLVLAYTASTVYHAIPASLTRAKRVLQVLDHASIFLLIAGTYTPLALVNLRGPWGWTLFGLVWGLAVAGIVLTTVAPVRMRNVKVVLYVGMGWLVVVAARPLIAAVPPGGLALLLAGGIAYTGGVAFYAWSRLRYHHAIWHGFVLAGSTFHFFAVLLYVVPAIG